MSDDEFHAYVGLLVLSGLVLSVPATRGFGEKPFARVVDGLFSLGFLGYAGYLILAAPDTVWVFYYAFLVPVLAVVHMWRAHRRARARRFAAGFTPQQPYAAQPAPTPLTPFPPPPLPLGSEPAPEEPPHDHRRTTYEPRPSGLPSSASSPSSPAPGLPRDQAAPHAPAPSGLTGAREVSPGAYQAKPSGLHLPTPTEAAAAPPGDPAPRPSGLPTPAPTGRHSRGPGDLSPDSSARHASVSVPRVPGPDGFGWGPQPEPTEGGFGEAPYVGTHSGEQPAYRQPDPSPAVHAEPRIPAGTDNRGYGYPADPRYSDYGHGDTTPAAAGHYGYTEPPSDTAGYHSPAGQAGYADPRYPDEAYPQTAGADHHLVHETSSRLRQPAYLREYSLTEPSQPPDRGRHRATDAAEPPRDWPPHRP